MLKYTITVLTLLGTICLNSQSYKEYWVLSTKLNVRSLPDKNSKIVTVLNNGEQVFVKEVSKTEREENEWKNCEQINNLFGCWLEIRYKGFEGYVFSPFIGEDIMLYYEDSPIEYYPTVKYWYGINYDSILHEEIIKEIRTKVGNSISDFNELNFNILSTNQKQKSLFLLATNIKINEKAIGMYTEIQKNSDKCKTSLNPGDKEWLYFETKNHTVSSECYYLMATGNYKMSEYGAILEDHKIFVADAEPPNSKFITIQELTMHFGVKESFELEYCGDIDGDNKPDIIIRSCSTQECDCVLFLSSIADSNELLGKASVYTYFSGC